MVTANQTSFIGRRTDESFVFVSYAREDCYFVYPEIERLKGEGYTIWYDKEQIRAGRSWSNEIDQALEACSCFLVFITKRAVGSERVIGEIRQALSLKKPLVAVYWQKVVLPPDLQDHLQRVQVLEFYDLHRRSYESQLRRALSESVEPRPRYEEKNDDLAADLDAPSSPNTRGISPKPIFFILILLGILFSFLAIVTAAVPFFGSHVPGDPLNNRFAGLAVAALFLVVALGLYVTAFVVYRIYLRRT